MNQTPNRNSVSSSEKERRERVTHLMGGTYGDAENKMNDDQTKRRERRPVEEKTRPPRKGRFQNVPLEEKEMGSGKGDHHNAGKTTENSSSIPLPAGQGNSSRNNSGKLES